ncbi:LOW QUALITY PROTEIN: RxLR effector protein [Phytophthora megakarya]|uniref:RxLR effector protein n=1 Tax=Phytophthora megakarya TaxID=4795 RepID=A0A225W0C2_9STRA|nr:LOW QUALITY PROTEIN: RxLR effector protein [Phytophthora megakarya]
MRLTLALLAVITLTIGTETITAEPASISSKTPIRLAHSIGDALGDTNDKRFLPIKYLKVDDDKVENGDDDEERISATKLSDLIAGRTSVQFQKWKGMDRSVDEIEGKLWKHYKAGKLTKADLSDILRRYRDLP